MPEENIELSTVKEIEEMIENTKIFIDSYSGKRELNKDEINKCFKDLYETCNINFLIGSGYCHERLKTLGDLEVLIERNAQENVYDINRLNAIEALILYDFFRNSIFPHKDDIEARKSFKNSDTFMTKLIAKINDRNDKSLLKRVNLFTTNYDMFFELSLEINNIYYNDGFSGRLAPIFSTQNYNRLVKQIVQNTERESQIPTINLYKLHGSLAWNRNNTEISYNMNPIDALIAVEAVGGVFDDSSFMYDKTSETNIAATIDAIKKESSDFSMEITAETDKFLEQYRKLHIINPTKKKFEETLLSNVYYDLLRMYSNELEKNNSVLFVFGFSFKDEHIYSITKRALSNPSMIMYIFVFCVEELESFKNMFRDHHNVFFVYYLDKHKLIDLQEFNSLMFGD